MTSRDFCYWLQGFFELEKLTSNHPEKTVITDKQAECIKNHLAMVFVHEIDPSFGDKEKQKILADVHGGIIRDGGLPQMNC